MSDFFRRFWRDYPTPIQFSILLVVYVVAMAQIVPADHDCAKGVVVNIHVVGVQSR